MRHDQLGVDLEPRAETVARLARSVRRVEGEVPGGQFVERDAAERARELLGERLDVVVALRRGHRDRGDALRELQRLLDRVGRAATDVRLRHEPVDHDLDRVLVRLRQPDRLGQIAHLAVDPGARKSLAGQLLQELLVLALAPAHHRCEHLEPGPLRQFHDLVDDLLGRLATDRSPTVVAMGVPDPREQDPQVVVDLRDRADRGARVPGRRLLIDRDGRTQALDEVDVRLLHLPEELPGVRREGLDVATLALRVDGVERQRRFARPGEAGEDDQGVPGQLQRDVPEVVLPGAVDDEGVGAHVRRVYRAARTRLAGTAG